MPASGKRTRYVKAPPGATAGWVRPDTPSNRLSSRMPCQRVTIGEPPLLSRTRDRWRPGWPVRRDVRSERQLRRENGKPARHRHHGPLEAVTGRVTVPDTMVLY